MSQRNGRSPHSSPSKTDANGTGGGPVASASIGPLLTWSIQLVGSIGAAGLALPAAVGDALGRRLPSTASPRIDPTHERAASVTIFADHDPAEAGTVLDTRDPGA